MWKLSFISENNLETHVKETIKKYGDKLEPFTIQKFNSNIIDPIKLIFDKMVYQTSWEEIIQNEIFRQRDKSNNNDIGYFHQKIFSYMNACEVPNEGWDVVFSPPGKIVVSDTDTVSKVYVELKNKHNTMNSASAGKTYIKMQHQLLEDDDCACFLVEAIAKRSQNIAWSTTVDKKKVSHKRIRRVSIDKFYAMVTGEADAFYQVCMVLPEIIEKVVRNDDDISLPKDTVLEELEQKATMENITLAMAIYMLGFSTYDGFEKNQL